MKRNFFFCLELKECYTSAEGQVLFIGREVECCFSDCFMSCNESG